MIYVFLSSASRNPLSVKFVVVASKQQTQSFNDSYRDKPGKLFPHLHRFSHQNKVCCGLETKKGGSARLLFHTHYLVARHLRPYTQVSQVCMSSHRTDC